MSDFARLMELARESQPPPSNVDVPHVTGSGLVGEPLSCTMGTWTGEPDWYAYEWQSGGVHVGADSEVYVPLGSDVGQDVLCVVTAHNPGGSTAASPSNAISITATSRSRDQTRQRATSSRD